MTAVHPAYSQQKSNMRSDLSNSTVNASVPDQHFVASKLTYTEQIMWNISSFHIWNVLDGIAGNVKDASELKNGALLVEVQNEKQVEALFKNNLVGCYPVQVERRMSQLLVSC